MDLVFFALPRHDGDYSSTSYSLAKELSREHRVFYIENPHTYLDYFRMRSNEEIQNRKNALLKGKDIYTKIEDFPNLTIVTPQLVVPINWLSQGQLYNALSKVNDKIVFKTLKKVKEDFSLKDFIFINSFNPLFGKSFIDKIGAKLFIYHTVDDISQAAYLYKHGLDLENEMVQLADLTITTSKELKKLKSDYGKYIYHLPNACEVELFKRAHEDLAKPEEIKDVVGTLVTYTGNIEERVNYKLCLELAQQHKDKTFLYVGPLNSQEPDKNGLLKQENVRFIGARDLTQLPAYLKYSDCAIIPFAYNKQTKSIYPLKINEYLASGTPVVSTRFSDDINDFEDVANLVQTDEEFVLEVDKAINEDSNEKRNKRIEKSESNSWSHRAKEFWEILELYQKESGTKLEL